MLASSLIILVPVTAQAQMERIVVVGNRSDGGNIMCRGQGCAAAMAQLFREIGGLRQSIDRDSTVEITPTQEQVCTALKKTKPASCGAKPSIAGLDGIGGNGCGSGIVSRGLAWVTFATQYPTEFTGNVDAPARGASFRASCDAHDVCYATQSQTQQNCDRVFNTDMATTCLSAASPNVCGEMANKYTAAVAIVGASAYAESAASLACYTFHSNLEANGCPK